MDLFQGVVFCAKHLGNEEGNSLEFESDLGWAATPNPPVGCFASLVEGVLLWRLFLMRELFKGCAPT